MPEYDHAMRLYPLPTCVRVFFFLAPRLLSRLFPDLGTVGGPRGQVRQLPHDV